MQKKAFTIAIEGSDGAGKQTQTNLLRTMLEARFKVVSVSFPRYKHTRGGKFLHEAFKSERAGNYDFAEMPPKPASLIYAADRLESRDFLIDLIANHDVVIFDRYVESNLLHQGGKLPEGERESFAAWLYDLEYGLNELPRPDLMIYLHIPFGISMARAKRRAALKNDSPDALEGNVDYVKKGHEAGIFYAKHFGWNIIECAETKELTDIEVHQKILEVITPHFEANGLL